MERMSKLRRRELELFNMAQGKAKELTACITTNDPINKQTLYRVYCWLWELGYTYRSEKCSYYVPKRDLDKIKGRLSAYEERIVEGDYKAEAQQAVADCKEYINLAIAYRVRDSRKTRVY